MKKLFYLLPVFCISLLFFTCRKDGAEPSNSLTGKWRFVNAVGGFTGRAVINPKGVELYTFKADSTFTRTRNDTLQAQGYFHIGAEKSIFTGTMAANINFNSRAAISGLLISVKNDSLMLTDNHVEPYGYLYVRVK